MSLPSLSNISDILKKYEVKKSNTGKPVDVNFEEAQQFGKKTGVKPTFVLRCFKMFGKPAVLSLESYMTDVNAHKSREGLLMWKLKQNKANKNG